MLFPLPGMLFPTFLLCTSSAFKASSDATSSGTPFPLFPHPHSIVEEFLPCSSRLPCPLVPVVTCQCCPCPPDLSASRVCGKSSLSRAPSLAPDPGRESRCAINVSQSNSGESCPRVQIDPAGQTSPWLPVSIRSGPSGHLIMSKQSTPRPLLTAHNVPNGVWVLESLPSPSQHTGKFTKSQPDSSQTLDRNHNVWLTNI